jgi:GT2 family glycosyltransferase
VTRIGVVVLTMGTRPVDLDRALTSVVAQQDVDLDVVCVGNGWAPEGLPPGVRAVGLPENVGIPAGRNAGAAAVEADLLFFLDDDASLPDDRTLSRLAARFDQHPRLGLVQPRVEDPTGRPAPGRWVPRLRAGDHTRPGPATSLWEGAVMIRRAVFDVCGGWPDSFFYAHEGIDLCWRTWDSGHVAWYAGDEPVHHPVIDPRRHTEFYRLNARNRVYLARRNLPHPVGVLYVTSWVVLTVLRVRDRAALRAWFGGLREGYRSDPGDRRPMGWRTVWHLTRAGRPPVV